MNRVLAWGCLLLATSCGAGTSVSVTQPGALAVKDWCAQYHQVVDATGLDEGPPAVDGPAFLAMMAKLQTLADRAPAEIRDDLQAVWMTPEEMLRSMPPPPAAGPDNADELVEQSADLLERPLRWVLDNCGDEPSLPVPPGGDLRSPEFPEPVGEWEPVQRGAVGGSKWTFFRTEATGDAVCVAFEAEPSHVDWQGRLRAQVPPGMPVPPMPPPMVPEGIGAGYKGKLAQCGPAPDLFERSDPVVFWVQDQDATNRFNVLAGLVVDSARSLTVTFEEGGRQLVSPVDGTFVATYDPQLHVAKVVPDLGAGSKVTCEPLAYGGLPAGLPDVLSLTCQGSTTRAGLPVPPFGLPQR